MIGIEKHDEQEIALGKNLYTYPDGDPLLLCPLRCVVAMLTGMNGSQTLDMRFQGTIFLSPTGQPACTRQWQRETHRFHDATLRALGLQLYKKHQHR